MKEVTNKYYTTDDRHFISYGAERPHPDRMRAIKFNNIFIFSTFDQFFNEEFPNTPVMQKYMPTILSGNLARTDKITGYNSKNLGEKLRFLVKTCIKSPEKLKMFKNSFFAQSVLTILSNGCTGGWANEQERWPSYKNLGDPFVAGMNTINGALKCYLNDPTVPVGIDVANLIDGIIKKDANGNYKIIADFDDIEKKEEMVEAMTAYVNLLKSTKRFKECYNNPLILDTENENE